MTLRVLHTADWHLGHRLHDVARDEEHGRFLGWLLDAIEGEEVDVLAVAGDVFDTANPPAAAQRAWYAFLAGAARRRPGLDVVVIGGNHDSAARLEAPAPLLDALRVHVVGSLPRLAGGALDLDRLLVPVGTKGTTGAGEPRAWIAAVPYLRPSDLSRSADVAGGPPVHPLDDPLVDPLDDPLVGGVRAVYAEVLAAARERAGASAAVLAMGHLYLAGTALSELSERKILGGNLHALPADLFGDAAYAALGHLHLAQAVSRPEVRYSGSPIPMSLTERNYPHQVVLVSLEGAAVSEVRALPVPRAVPFLRVPDSGSLPLGDALSRLEALEVPPGPRPFLEVAVTLAGPEPTLRRDVEAALRGKDVHLARIVPSYTGSGLALADAVSGAGLRDLDPAAVFLRRWSRDHEGEPPPELTAAFEEALDLARLQLEEAAS